VVPPAFAAPARHGILRAPWRRRRALYRRGNVVRALAHQCSARRRLAARLIGAQAGESRPLRSRDGAAFGSARRGPPVGAAGGLRPPTVRIMYPPARTAPNRRSEVESGSAVDWCPGIYGGVCGTGRGTVGGDGRLTSAAFDKRNETASCEVRPDRSRSWTWHFHRRASPSRAATLPSAEGECPG
jgi:hypothetical protein